MLQTIGALGLLTLLILNANRAVLGIHALLYGQFAESALLIAQSYILDATTKDFDENPSVRAIKDPSKFSSLLGPDGRRAPSVPSTM